MTAMAETGARSAGDLEHRALFYRDEDEFSAGVVPFVREGLAVGEPALVALAGKRVDLVRDRLGAHIAGVRFLDAGVIARNPGRIIPEVLWPFAAAHPGRRVRVVGESIWPGRAGFEYQACVAYESAINAVFAGHDATMLCLYDAVGLPEVALSDAVRTHPLLTRGADVSLNPGYVPPEVMVLRGQPLPAPPATAATMTYSGVVMLRQVRRFVAAHAAAAALCSERIDELCVAVNELAANTCRHTDGPGRVSAWVEADVLVCQIDDEGYISDPTVGRTPRGHDSTGGRGLLMAHRLCDLVCVYSSDDGTRIRVHINR
ncbi:sensor histidine kinase [Planosporangium flavigriseum]|uniref:Anti-sigma regulatory factor n=1 Tax=Planosporangium flavigriseum TaxID=373681 RepID=A0A8J3PQB6_9ACTN|nr:sensor histidine kinase [Planosporangium flavigriseum]NJC66463.1 sensor histidine kinase [Planosporangium flavigriseum]GIG76773.1 anti-sigma regulatory factor [Planosporangium flavigriseum]